MDWAPNATDLVMDFQILANPWFGPAESLVNLYTISIRVAVKVDCLPVVAATLRL
jgi:hypothetical protein